MLRSTIVAFVLATVLSPLVADAACTASSSAPPPRLIELYTSEGCSSCPPADRWLRSLTGDARYVGLEYHVDYWDALGWTDPYADPRFGARQRELARHAGSSTVYTPEVAIDGRIWKDWPNAPPARAETSAPALKLSVERGPPLRVSIEGAAGSDARVFAALTENGLESDVSAGENSGRRLVHDDVVRAFAGPLELPIATTTLDAPSDLDRTRSAVVAFVEDARSGAILDVVRVPLAACGI